MHDIAAGKKRIVFLLYLNACYIEEFCMNMDLDYQQVLRQSNGHELNVAVKIFLIKEKSFFGPGTVQLLSLIEETGSVRLACERMTMSYSKAWKIIKTIEDQLGYNLVRRQQGGKNGGNASLTPEGKRMLDKFSLFENRCKASIQKIFEDCFVNKGE